ncbi:MDR family NADP-dependent oxidoreductase [Burkholderia sp. F1]|uniref:MDR family NADP-dependent oxidoreductase n=1 Tax=Burkholderia sp. F1 TaxID=3366817 RepID=UPI003D713F0F
MPIETQSGHEIRLKSRPAGLPTSEHFELIAVQIPSPNATQVLVRNLFFVISPSLRQMISEGARNIPGVPFPAFSPGDALMGQAIAEVDSAPEGSGLKPGDLVQHPYGWRDYALVPIAQCLRIGKPFADPVGVLAYLGHGWTAYAALTRGVQIARGDTVFVSSAAGAIGSMAGQIARLLGARRVIGSTSTQEKANRLITELGYDAAIIRETQESLTSQLRQAAPNGIDVMLDSVGGEQLRAATEVANEGGRILVIGTLSGQLAPSGNGRVAPVQLDSKQILLKKLMIRGYSADHDPKAMQAWRSQFSTWLEAGQIQFPFSIVKGLASAPGALQEATKGSYLGAVFVQP